MFLYILYARSNFAMLYAMYKFWLLRLTFNTVFPDIIVLGDKSIVDNVDKKMVETGKWHKTQRVSQQKFSFYLASYHPYTTPHNTT